VQLHFDVKPANMSFMPCPAGGPPHITLLDMGAVTHIAALHTPQRSTLYPVVSTDHMDVALITLQPGQVRCTICHFSFLIFCKICHFSFILFLTFYINQKNRWGGFAGKQTAVMNKLAAAARRGAVRYQYPLHRRRVRACIVNCMCSTALYISGCWLAVLCADVSAGPAAIRDQAGLS
jgi:hypothetical protein